MTNPTTTAKATLNLIAGYVARDILPVARGAAISGTLQQIGQIAGDLTLEPRDVALAYQEVPRGRAARGLHLRVSAVDDSVVADPARRRELSLPRESDAGDQRVAARRQTCAQVAQVAATCQFINWERTDRFSAHVSLAARRMCAVLEALVIALESSTDPRHVSMVETARSEIDELSRVARVI